MVLPVLRCVTGVRDKQQFLIRARQLIVIHLMYILGKVLSVLVSLGWPHLWVIDACLIVGAPPLPRSRGFVMLMESYKMKEPLYLYQHGPRLHQLLLKLLQERQHESKKKRRDF